MTGERIWAVSDLHTDIRANREALERTPLDGYGADTLIVAGDVADRLEVVRETLSLLVSRFRAVFFVPGNHELWVRGERRDSLDKFRAVLELCAELGVRTSPARAAGAWVVPLFSWYEAAFDLAGEGVESELEAWSDRYFCRWPDGLPPSDAFLRMNLPHLRGYDGPVVTFSHFVPRPELVPAVRHLTFRGLPLVAGSVGIERQLRAVGSRVHVFGHTHIPADREIEGVRYVQNHFGASADGPFALVWRAPAEALPEPVFC
jgi:predicted phosphodiesterase